MRRLLRFFRNLSNRQFTPLVEVLLHQDRLLRNLDVFREVLPETAIAPVLKSNAYGHGLVQVAAVLAQRQVPFLCIDSLFEARILRAHSIKTPLLIIGHTPLENIAHRQDGDIAFSILSFAELEMLAGTLKTPRMFHLKIDTGMHRHGVLLSELDEAVRIIKVHPCLVIEGVFSHLADADNDSSALNEMQIRRWNEAVQLIHRELPKVKYWHLAATAGARYSSRVDANTLRLGLGLYGVGKGPDGVALMPVLAMRSRISSLRRVGAGEPIGYGALFRAPQEITVATAPAGYYEGVDWRLSNNGAVLVGDKACPIVGRVSMNVTSFDVSALPDVRIGDQVTLISADAAAPNSVQEIARRCAAIPYEILAHIPSHLRRVVV